MFEQLNLNNVVMNNAFNTYTVNFSIWNADSGSKNEAKYSGIWSHFWTSFSVPWVRGQLNLNDFSTFSFAFSRHFCVKNERKISENVIADASHAISYENKRKERRLLKFSRLTMSKESKFTFKTQTKCNSIPFLLEYLCWRGFHTYKQLLETNNLSWKTYKFRKIQISTDISRSEKSLKKRPMPEKNGQK